MNNLADQRISFRHGMRSQPRFGVRSVLADRIIYSRALSGHYSSISETTRPLTVRQWLSSKSFEAQRAYGIEKLREFGAIP